MEAKTLESLGVCLESKNGRLYCWENLDFWGYNLGIISLPDNLTVGGCLDLGETEIDSLPENLVVEGVLCLQRTKIKSLSNNLVVGGSLDLRYTSVVSLPEKLTVGGCLDLRGTGVTSLPKDLIVGGDLNLSGTAITALPDNLIVGGDLDLSETGVKDLPKNLVVVGNLNLYGTGITDARACKRVPFFYECRGKKYMKQDGVFAEVLYFEDNFYIVKRIGKPRPSCIVTDGDGEWAHAFSLKKAKEELAYKLKLRTHSDLE